MRILFIFLVPVVSNASELYWVLNISTSPAFNFTFSYTIWIWFVLVGVIVGVKILKEAFRR